MIFIQSSWSFIYSCRVLLKFTSSDPKPPLSCCPLSVVHVLTFLTFLSSSQEPLGQFQTNLAHSWVKEIFFFFFRIKSSSFFQNADIDIFAFLIQCTGIIIGCWSLCSVRNCFLGEPCSLLATYFTISNYVLFPPSKPIQIHVLEHQQNFVFMINFFYFSLFSFSCNLPSK